MGAGRLQPGFGAGVDEFGRCAEQGDARHIGIIEQRVAVRMEGRAVVEDDGRLRSEGADHPVPHHPAAGREPEHPVARLHIAVEAVLLRVGQQGRADGMDDAFRRAGRARGIEDVERIVEAEPGEFDLARRVGRGEIVEQNGAGHSRDIRRCPLGRGDIRHDQHLFERRHAGGDLRQLVEAGLDPAIVEIAVGGDQHPGRDLAETVEHALDAEIRRRRSEDAADAGRCQHGDRRFGNIGHVGRDPVAGAEPHGAPRPGEARDRVMEFGPADLPADPVFAAEDDGRRIVAPAQQILGEIHPAVREEAGARHPVAIDDDAPARLADHGAEIPQAGPEFLRLVHRPGVQGGIIGEIRAPSGRSPPA